MPGAGQRRRNADKPGTRSEIEDVLFPYARRMVEHIARHPLTAGPCKRPEGRGKAERREFLFRPVPQIMCLIGEMKLDLRNMRRRLQRCVVQHKSAESIASGLENRRLRSGHSGAGVRPPMRQTSTHSSGMTG